MGGGKKAPLFQTASSFLPRPFVQKYPLFSFSVLAFSVIQFPSPFRIFNKETIDITA